ncbi:hypothetical protein [Methylophaga sp. UBA2689]|uniref:hypothetical protein n=1 Tax=Methylophaga sp. UBA2689 TaxID=1946878 RepID=UPI0025E541E8|nr:hypothetical protein [Methylophaga sp. UBA2689]|tara:strand:+ start:3495 stop:4466 length:972 start_codon:yes stop_codon:yes gene_type:complete
MNPIIIDAATIYDPARLIAVLASVDIRHSEVWVSQRYDHFKEKDFLTGWGTDDRIGLLPARDGSYKAKPLDIPSPDEKLNPTHCDTGPKILRWALDKGMAVPKDLFKFEELAIELEKENRIDHLSEAIMLGAPTAYDMRAGEEWTKEYLKKTGQESLGPEFAWRLEPYGIGHGLGLMLAAASEYSVQPFFSHPFFRDGSSTHNYTYYKRDQRIGASSDAYISRDTQDVEIGGSLIEAQNLLRSPEAISLSEVAFYLKQKERIDSITGIITASKNIESRGKDIGIITSKYAGTIVADTMLFGGLPLTTSAVSLYDIGVRFFKSK